MAKQTRRLGRGIASLIDEATEASEGALDRSTQSTPTNREIPAQSILPNPMQPRSHLDPRRLDELADSIRASGVIQPVVVRPRGDHYELLTGERRVRAARQAGLSTLPAVIREATDQQMIEFALIENIQREDLNPMDRAAAYRQCCARFGLSADALAERLGEDRSTVANYVRLLDLPESVQHLVRDGSLSMGHARSLLGLADHAEMERLAQQAVENALTVRHLEDLVREAKEPSPEPSGAPGRKPRPKRPLIQDLEQRFSQAMQTRVTIREGRKKNTGKVIIEYFNLDDFDRIAERLGVELEEI